MSIVVIVLAAFLAGYGLHRFLANRPATRASGETSLSEFEALVTTPQFDSMVIATSHERPVMVDFFATWCGPCQYLAPRLAEFARDYAGAFLLAKVDVDANQELATRYGIQSMPTVLLFKDGKVVDRFGGAVGDHTIRYFLARNGVRAGVVSEESAG